MHFEQDKRGQHSYEKVSKSNNQKRLHAAKLRIRHGQVSKVSAVFYLVPAIAALIAWVMFGETLSLLQIGGMAICALAVAIATRPEAASR